jgi:hypothetical protein
MAWVEEFGEGEGEGEGDNAGREVCMMSKLA